MKEISIPELLKIALNRWWIITISAVLCFVLALSYCLFVAKPVYQASSSILVNNGALTNNEETSSTISTSTMSASLYLVDTCVDVCKSANLYKELATAMGNQYTYKQLQSRFQVSSRSESSLFIDIAVRDVSPEEAKQIANAYLNILPQYMKEVIPAVDIKIMANAEGASKVSPHTARLSVLAAVVGAVLAYVICVLITLFNNIISSEEDFKNHYDLPLLGVVPNFDNKKTKGNSYGRYE